MAEDVKYFKLGLFSAVAVGLLTSGIVLLGVMDYFRPSFTVETCFFVQSVRGLEVGAPVKFRGVASGRVTEIALAGLVYEQEEIIAALEAGDTERLTGTELRSSILVRMEIVPQKGMRDLGDLRQDLLKEMVNLGFRAQLAQSGLAGPVFIDMEYLDPEIYPAAELPWEPEHFYIPSAPGTLTELTGAATAMLNRLRKMDLTATFETLDQTFEALKELSEGIDVAEVQQALVALAGDARGWGQQLQVFLDDPRFEQAVTNLLDSAVQMTEVLGDREQGVGATLQRIPRAAAHLEQVAARADALLGDERVNQILEGMSQVAGGAGKTMEDAGTTTAELKRLVRELNRLTMILNDDLSVITDNLRRITEDAEVITGEIRDNPARLIFGEDPPHLNPGEVESGKETP